MRKKISCMKFKELTRLQKLIEATNCEVDIPSLLQIQTFKTKDTLQIYPHKEHNHLEGVKSFVLREERPLDLQKLNEWMSAVVQELGNIYIVTKEFYR